MNLLRENPCQHPIIILPNEVTASDLRYVLEFVYRGEVNLAKSELDSFLRAAANLQITAICEKVTS